MVISIPEVVLSSSSGSRKMPVLGMGTAASPPLPSGQIKAAILEAIEVGYRNFDTASLYLTEEPLGQAIAEALSTGLIKSRDEIFITSKLWCSDAHSNLVLPALQKSLKYIKLPAKEQAIFILVSLISFINFIVYNSAGPFNWSTLIFI